MNATDPNAQSIHGVNPQTLVEKIMRNRIYSSVYWKEECFGLTAETLVDKAVELSEVGGTFGGNQQPTHFLCLLLKMLQLQPELEVAKEFVQNDDYKYVTVLGAVYLRLVGKSLEIYSLLEPLLSDYRKIRRRTVMGWEITHVDEVVDALLHEEFYLDLSLPRLVDREVLERTEGLAPRRSPLEDELDAASDSDSDSSEDEKEE
ncbi:Pre-mRNA-splicing factor 38A [Phytophthora megakarya]|uniref:Pre-mRNA-splicing factor 38 n=1 Tax=Phytophthora megakarya TaxID=4795 RepID=A0A225UD21_9STRA|nr:Pre-mRNA-splicing factor 38A [Phytophthora megakarya]